MPKLKPTEREEINRIVRSCIVGGMERQGLSSSDMARKLSVSEGTIRNRMNNPSDFTVRELVCAAKALKFTPFQAASIILGREITVKEVFDGVLKF